MAGPKVFGLNAVNGAGDSKSELAPVRFPMEYFNHRQGLNSGQVHQTVQALTGHIWSTTPLGLSRYDGVALKMFHQKKFLSSHGLRAIAVGPDGLLWVGSDKGIDLLDVSSGEPRIVSFDPIGTVNCIAVCDGTVWVGTTQGLFHNTEHGKLLRSHFPELAEATITSIIGHRNRDIWITGPKIGAWAFPSGFDQPVQIDCPPQLGTPSALSAGPDGSTIIGGDQGLAQFSADRDLICSCRTDQPVLSLLWDDGNIWAGLGGSLVELDPENPSDPQTRLLIDGISVLDMFVDNFRNVWLSTDTHALCRINGIRHLFRSPPQMDIGGVFCISGKKDQLLLGGAFGLALPDGRVTLSGIKVWDALFDKKGKLWAATQQGLYCAVNPHFNIPYRHKECAVFAAPGRTLMEYKGEIYVGSTRGLAKMCANGPIEILTPEKEALGYVYSLHVGPQGALWIATLGNGLWKLENGEALQICSEDLTNSDNVYALTHAPSGEIFVAHNGLISKISREGDIHTLTDTGDAIAAWALDFIHNGYVIAGTSTGLVFYNAETGKRGYYITGGSQEKLWEFTTSRSLRIFDQTEIFGGTSSGLFSLSIPPVPPGLGRPSAKIAHVEWRDVTPETKDGQVIVSTGHWHLIITLQTVWYLDEYDCSMRFRLKGFDKDWSPMRSVGDIVYTSVPAGQYALEIELTSPLAGTGPVQQVFEFVVRDD